MHLIAYKGFLLGGQGQNRTADTRIFSCHNLLFLLILRPPTLANSRQNYSFTSRSPSSEFTSPPQTTVQRSCSHQTSLLNPIS